MVEKAPCASGEVRARSTAAWATVVLAEPFNAGATAHHAGTDWYTSRSRRPAAPAVADLGGRCPPNRRVSSGRGLAFSSR